MPFPKGNIANPKGRPRGCATPEARLRQHQIERLFDFLLQASMVDILRQPQRRFEYLRILLPYVSKRKVAALLPREPITDDKLEAELAKLEKEMGAMINNHTTP